MSIFWEFGFPEGLARNRQCSPKKNENHNCVKEGDVKREEKSV
jgi:hypothetical protein